MQFNHGKILASRVRFKAKPRKWEILLLEIVAHVVGFPTKKEDGEDFFKILFNK